MNWICAVAMFCIELLSVMLGAESKSFSRQRASFERNELLGRKLDDVDASRHSASCDGNLQSSSFAESLHGKNERYLMITTVAEQLSKARFHLAELMYVARLTKRTLVLPKYQDGLLRNGLYANQSLCTIFNVKKVGEYVPWVSEDIFLARMAQVKRHNGRLPPFYSLQLLDIHRSCSKDVVEPLFPGPQSSKHDLTMADFSHGSFVCANCMGIHNPAPMLSLVLDSRVNSTSVLVIQKKTADRCFDYQPVLPFVQYSVNLTRTVDQFVNRNLGPRFLSIQWRIEKLTLLNLPSTAEIVTRCGRGLIKTARGLTRQHNLRRVFIAADISPDNITHSSSFGLSSATRSTVLSTVRKVFKSLKPTTWNEFNGDISRLDSAALGILDKLTCSEGYIFLYPPNWCFGVAEKSMLPSSYTLEILDIRKSKRIPSYRSQAWEIE